MNFSICPNCKMRVLPKADGTCPSCQAILSPIKTPSGSIKPRKSSAAAAALKQAASPAVRKKTAKVLDKPDKSIPLTRQAVLPDPDKKDARENMAHDVPRQADIAAHQAEETSQKKGVKMNDTLKMILLALAAGFLYGAYKTVVSILNK